MLSSSKQSDFNRNGLFGLSPLPEESSCTELCGDKTKVEKMEAKVRIELEIVLILKVVAAHTITLHKLWALKLMRDQYVRFHGVDCITKSLHKG